MADMHSLIRDRLAHSDEGLLGSESCVLGMDLGSYGLRVALADTSSQTFASRNIEFRGDTPDQVVENAIALAHELFAETDIPLSRLTRVGAGFGGPVDNRYGTIRLSPRRQGWDQYPLQERLEQAFDAVTLVDNDANLTALGEAIFGCGQGCKHLFYIHLSSGVGGGVVVDGRLYHGASAMAGEIGHAVVGQGWDGNDRPATLEELVSIAGLLGRARALGLDTDNLNDVFGAHPAGKQVVHETVQLLAVRIAQIVALLDPEIVVLGGIVVRIGGDEFVQSIAGLVEQFTVPLLPRSIRIAASELGEDSVTVGALAVALESLRE